MSPMSPEEKRLLEETLELAEENNQILRRMQRSARLSKIFRVLYWVVIVLVAVGIYLYIQPFLEQFMEAYDGAREIMENFGGLIGGAEE